MQAVHAVAVNKCPMISRIDLYEKNIFWYPLYVYLPKLRILTDCRHHAKLLFSSTNSLLADEDNEMNRVSFRTAKP